VEGKKAVLIVSINICKGHLKAFLQISSKFLPVKDNRDVFFKGVLYMMSPSVQEPAEVLIE
jgi:hypothetical protein